MRRASAPHASGPNSNWNLEPIKGLLPRGARRRRGWSFRIGGLFVLLALAIGAGVFSTRTEGPTQPMSDAAKTDADSAIVETPSQPDVADQGTLTPPAPPTALAIGVGGGEATDVGGSSASTDQTVLTAGESESSRVAFQNAVPTSGAVPGAPPVSVLPAPMPTAVGSSSKKPPATAPDGLTGQTPTVRRPAEKDDPPALRRPAVSTAVVAQERETPRSVARVGSLRLTAEAVARGRTLPKFGLAGSGEGEWVAITVEIESWAGMSGELAMTEFQLRATKGGETIDLDSGTALVAELAGLEPAYGAADVVTIGSGDAGRVLLVFQVPAKMGEVELVIGEETITLPS